MHKIAIVQIDLAPNSSSVCFRHGIFIQSSSIDITNPSLILLCMYSFRPTSSTTFPTSVSCRTKRKWRTEPTIFIAWNEQHVWKSRHVETWTQHRTDESSCSEFIAFLIIFSKHDTRLHSFDIDFPRKAMLKRFATIYNSPS